MSEAKRKSRMFVFILICSGVGLLLLSHSTANAQSILFHGQVIDGTSLENLADVHVFKSAHVGTSTDIDGGFHFKVNYLDTVYFSRLGYDSLQIIIQSEDDMQSMMLSMHRSTIILESVEIKASDFQAPTIIKRYKPQPMRVPGVYYSDKVYESNYKMGIGAIGSPATAIYRLISKQYKQEKKNYAYLKEKEVSDAQFTLAAENLDEAFELIDEYLDPYYYRDFIHHSGLTMRYVAESSLAELISILPQALETYNQHLDDRSEFKGQ